LVDPRVGDGAWVVDQGGWWEKRDSEGKLGSTLAHVVAGTYAPLSFLTSKLASGSGRALPDVGKHASTLGLLFRITPISLHDLLLAIDKCKVSRRLHDMVKSVSP
jgi:hypothetical protein